MHKDPNPQSLTPPASVRTTLEESGCQRGLVLYCGDTEHPVSVQNGMCARYLMLVFISEEVMKTRVDLAASVVEGSL